MGKNNCKEIDGINFDEFNEALSKNPEENESLAEFLKPIIDKIKIDWGVKSDEFVESFRNGIYCKKDK